MRHTIHCYLAVHSQEADALQRRPRHAAAGAASRQLPRRDGSGLAKVRRHGAARRAVGSGGRLQNGAEAQEVVGRIWNLNWKRKATSSKALKLWLFCRAHLEGSAL